MMIFNNHLTKQEVQPTGRPLSRLCCCWPHLPCTSPRSCGNALGHKDTLAYEPWPKADPALLKTDTIEVPVQVNGKLRSKLTVPSGQRRKNDRSGGDGGREGNGVHCREAGQEGDCRERKLVNIVVAG